MVYHAFYTFPYHYTIFQFFFIMSDKQYDSVLVGYAKSLATTMENSQAGAVKTVDTSSKK